MVFIDYDDVLKEAARKGCTIELVEAPDYGWDFEIDGQRLLDEDHGFPREMFGLEAKDLSEFAEELLEERRRRNSRRRRRHIPGNAHVTTHGYTVLQFQTGGQTDV